MSAITFALEKKSKDSLARVGTLTTVHGVIETPSFVVVGTKGTVKTLTPEQVSSLGAQVVLGNTYHLYLEPGDEVVRDAGGLHKFMGWEGPMMTDSGGFQVFSLGAAYGLMANKFETKESPEVPLKKENHAQLVHIDEEGVTFRSHIDGSKHRLTPEKSIDIQHNLGADILFAFDECTLPTASHDYQKEALERTHRWAERSLTHHVKLNKGSESTQALFGIVQGGRFSDLREESAKTIRAMDFDGFGIGGSFSKEDLEATLHRVNTLLPEDKPRHLLGIGEPMDLFHGIEQGIDTFDCVSPTRIARTGMLYTKAGRISIAKTEYKRDFKPIEEDCMCYTCLNYSRAYLSHLFRAKEVLGLTLASIHNLHFIVKLVDTIRHSLLEDTFKTYKEDFLRKYYPS